MNPRLLQRETIFSMRSLAFNSAIPKRRSVMDEERWGKFEWDARELRVVAEFTWAASLDRG